MRRCIPVVVLVVLATAGTAFGEFYGTVDMTVGLPGNNQTATFSWASGEEVYVGPYQYNLSNPTGTVSSLLGGNSLVVNGFCVDFTTNIYVGPSYKTDVLDLGDPGTLHNLPVGSSIDSIVPHIEELMYEYQNAGGTPATPTSSPLGTALQYALWEVTNAPATAPYNVGNNLISDSYGETSASDSVVPSSLTGVTLPAQIANFWLNNMDPGDTYYKNDSFWLLGNGIYALVPEDGSQIQSVVIALGYSHNYSGTPEPMGLVALAGLALCGLPVGAKAFFSRFRKA
jgi:hypothetical protein